MSDKAGPVVLFGSGETTAAGRRVFEWLFRQMPVPVRVAILETPAGFELNSAQVAGRIDRFLRERLQNYRPDVTIVPARKRMSAFSPDDPSLAALMPGSHVIFLGPGSPTYAVRQLQGSTVWETAVGCHQAGAALVLASAATVAVGARALPVYEIYKAGEDPYWRAGLDLFGPYGLPLVFVPHWNNQDGGAELDTSRCFMGQSRFEPLVELLSPEVTVVGIDEKTGLALDLVDQSCLVLGRGGVTLRRERTTRRFGAGQGFSMHDLGAYHRPAVRTGIPADVLAIAEAAQSRAAKLAEPPAQVLSLVQEREASRANNDWASADALRQRIADLGWQVLDTREGPCLERAGSRAG